MHPVSESLIGQILNPAPMSGEPGGEAGGERVTLEQIVTPPGQKGAAYAGPERRAQGYLVAEVIPESPALDRQSPEFDPPR